MTYTPPEAGDAAQTSPKPIGVPLAYVQPHDVGGWQYGLLDEWQYDPSELGPVAAFKGVNQWAEYAPGAESGEFQWNPNLGGQAYYSAGDEYAPQSWGPENIAEIQAALDAAGYLSGTYVEGGWDPKSANAFEKLLGLANSLGVSWQEALRMGGSGGASGKGKGSGSGSGRGGGGGLGAAQITDDDIKAILNKTAQGVLGRNLREDEIGAGLSAFRGGLGTGTSPTVVAEQTVRGGAPAESGAHDIGTVLGVFQQMIGGRSG